MTSSSPGAADEVTIELNVKAPKWFAKNIRHVCDGALNRSHRYRDTVRSETVMPSFTNSPWIRGAPQRRFSVAMRRMRARTSATMRGLPGRRRGRRRQHPRNPSRCQRATVAGWTRTRASCQRGHQRRKHSQSKRPAERKRRSERPRTPSWWRSAKYSKRRSLRDDKADRSVAIVWKALRIAGRMASG
jgi:hypothetical protein